MRYLFSTAIIMFILMLIGCNTFQTNTVPSGKTKYVETENFQWDSAPEEQQELSDEI